MSDFSEKRSFGLDAVRATAIVVVLISHARQALVDPDSGLALTFGGWFGVELFFALSGFLIGTILIRLFDKGATPAGLGRFWFRRWMRTLPAYFFILLFYWVVFGKVQFSDFILLQWPISHNGRVIPVSWSLAVEEWFYVLFPVAALIATAIFKKHGMIVAIIAAISLPFLFRAYQFSAGYNATEIRLNPFRFDGMAYGVLAAYLIAMKSVRQALEHRWLTVSIVAFMLLLTDFLRYNGARIGIPMPFAIPVWHHHVTAYTVSGVCAAMIVVALYLRRADFGVRFSAVVTYISKVGIIYLTERF